MELRQGKCKKCKVAFRWPAKDRPLFLAYCPRCGEKLHATTHLLRWPWVFWKTSKKGNYYLEPIEIPLRKGNLSHSHHIEVASIHQIEEDKAGKLKLSPKPDKEKMQELLEKAEKENLSIRELRELVARYKRQK